ncbi:hypothetical protein AWB74_08549 [Caballeronia arvi]|uniref:Uncharacterized protein n=1 Tax=Caballeronia arvi TaxID=1777135 RepID=A0A158L5W8_9BURK|nr:hypothetical protein [Caballeronia arvi]SAL88409.1 hypothetical protein AWB74_08549 [Caballeronia arvi]
MAPHQATKKKEAASEPAAEGRLTKKKARKKRTGRVELVSVSVASQGKEPLKKEKVVRDTFTMPRSDYGKIATLKQRCLEEGVLVNKSELLRAGLLLLEAASPEHLRDAVSAVEKIKTGRPPKSG